MGLLTKIFERGKKKRTGGDPLADHFYQSMDALAQGSTRVSPASAQRVAAVYACVSAICESVAMLPAAVYEESDGRSRRKATEHWLYKLVTDEPNSFMDSFLWFETMQEHILLYGNAYAFLNWRNSGAIIEMKPLDPERVTLKMNEQGRVVYTYRPDNGQPQEYDQDSILHVKHRSKDGITGRSPISVAAEVVGYSMNLQRHGNSMFENGAFLSGFLTAPHAFKDDEARRNFVNSFKQYMGAKNAGKFALLEQGVDYKPMQMNNKDAQFLEDRQFSVVEIARIFRVPPHMIQDLNQGASYSSIEHQSINFVTYTVQPWITRWERALKRQLLYRNGEENVWVRFDTQALLRGDLKSRTEAIVQQLQYGLKTINEARAELDENPVEGPIGDEVLLSHNLQPASKVLSDEPQVDDPTPDEPEPQDDADEPADNARFWEPIVEELVGRILRRESRLIKDALRKKVPLLKWAEEFVEEHRSFMRETLAPLSVAYCQRKDVSVERFINQHISQLECLFLVWKDESTIDGHHHKERVASVGVELVDFLRKAKYAGSKA